MSFLIAGRFGLHIQGAIKGRDRVASFLEKDGYKDRVINPMMRYYCSRQVLKIACEDTGYGDKFEETMSKPGADWKLTWLPHV